MIGMPHAPYVMHTSQYVMRSSLYVMLNLFNSFN